MKKILFTIIISIVFSIVMTASVYASTGKTNYPNVNFRAEATTDSESMGKIPEGTTVEIISYEDDWYKVKYNGKTGYVASKFLKDLYVEGTYSKIKTVTSNDTLNYTKKKLTKYTQYAFKVRSYKVIDGEKYFGTYSNVKKVTIKK